MEYKKGEIWTGDHGYIYLVTEKLASETNDVYRACLLETKPNWSDQYDIRINCLGYTLYTVRMSDGPLLGKTFKTHLGDVPPDVFEEFAAGLLKDPENIDPTYITASTYLMTKRYEVPGYVDSQASDYMSQVPIVKPGGGPVFLDNAIVVLDTDWVLDINTSANPDAVYITQGTATTLYGTTHTVTPGFWLLSINSEISYLHIAEM